MAHQPVKVASRPCQVVHQPSKVGQQTAVIVHQLAPSKLLKMGHQSSKGSQKIMVSGPWAHLRWPASHKSCALAQQGWTNKPQQWYTILRPWLTGHQHSKGGQQNHWWCICLTMGGTKPQQVVPSAHSDKQITAKIHQLGQRLICKGSSRSLHSCRLRGWRFFYKDSRPLESLAYLCTQISSSVSDSSLLNDLGILCSVYFLIHDVLVYVLKVRGKRFSLLFGL